MRAANPVSRTPHFEGPERGGSGAERLYALPRWDTTWGRRTEKGLGMGEPGVERPVAIGRYPAGEAAEGPEPERSAGPESTGRAHLQVTEGGPAETATQPPGSPTDVGYVLDALRTSLEQEFQIAERLAAKTRQLFALALAFFTVVQTVAFGSFASSDIAAGEKLAMLLIASLAIVVLAISAFIAARADTLVPARDVRLEDLRDDLNAAYEGDEAVPGRLAKYYLGVVRSRRAANETRRRRYGHLQYVAGASIAVTTIELVVSLASRIQ